VLCVITLTAMVLLSGCSSPSRAAVSSASPTSSHSFSTLLPTVLATVPPFTYADSRAAHDALHRGQVDSVLSAFSGGVSRDLVLDGDIVGGVLYYRFGDEVPVADRSRFPPMIVYTFAGASPHQAQVGGQVVQRVDRAPDGRTVVGWTHEDYLVVVWARDLHVATTYAGDYILRSM
jgi:hypothetical protein